MTKLRLMGLAVLMTTIGLAFPSKLHAQSKSMTALAVRAQFPTRPGPECPMRR